MRTSRRTFLTAALAAAVLPAGATIFAEAASANPTPDDFAKLREKWADILTGRKEIRTDDPRFAAALSSLDRSVPRIQSSIDRSPDRVTVIKNAPLNEENSAALTTTARAAKTLAQAWATPASAYHHNKDVLADIENIITGLLELKYGPQHNADRYGNWWHWEIGATRALADTICMAHGGLSEELINNVAAAIDHHVPDPWNHLTPDLQFRSVSAGANRVDMCRAIVCRAIATGDGDKLSHALDGLSDTWAFVDTGDGFYRDGSFIQHNHVAYTGSYGDVLLGGWALLLGLVGGSPLAVSPKVFKTVAQRVNSAFIPVIVEGQIIEMVRGRSISRMNASAMYHGRSIMKAMLMLADGADAKTAEHWRDQCRAWIAENSYDDFLEGLGVADLAIFTKLLRRPVKKVAPVDSEMFASMDRLVHRAPGWTFGLSLCSNRISWYEYGNGENEWGSRTGLGMRYLLLPDDMGQYENEYWPTVNYAALPGITSDESVLERAVNKAWGGDLPQNEWTGGLVSGEHSTAAAQLLPPQDNMVQVRRAWLASPHMIVEAAADFVGATGTPYTVVEHRNLGADASRSLVVDGTKISAATEVQDARWAHLEGIAGYVFLKPSHVRAQVEARTGTWANVNTRNKGKEAEAEQTRQYANLHLVHNDPSAAWVILPGATKKQTEAFAKALEDGGSASKNRDASGGDAGVPASVLVNDGSAQVIDADGVRSFAVWKPGKYAEWSFANPVIALLKVDGKAGMVSVADPTQGAESVQFTLPAGWSAKAEDGVTVQAQDNGDVVTVKTAGLAGSPRVVTLTVPADAADGGDKGGDTGGDKGGDKGGTTPAPSPSAGSPSPSQSPAPSTPASPSASATPAPSMPSKSPSMPSKAPAKPAPSSAPSSRPYLPRTGSDSDVTAAWGAGLLATGAAVAGGAALMKHRERKAAEATAHARSTDDTEGTA